MTDTTPIESTPAAQAAATTARSQVKVWGLSQSTWFTLVGIVVLVLSALAISSGVTWTFAMRLAWAAALWIIAGQLAKFKVSSIGGWTNVPQTFRAAAITLAFFAVILSGIGQWTGWALNETDDCFSSFVSGDYSDCGTEIRPGTEDVTANRYFANATGGAYELRDDSWLVFHWPDGGHCVRTKGVDVGYIQRIRDADDQYWILSQSGVDTINVKVLAPGETWNNYTCPRQ